MIKKIFKNYGHYIYLYFFSCFALLLCSHFSPLYEYNFSVDPSAYLTVGRGLMNGLVPYKDLFDIKGPIIFVLFGIFSFLKINSNYFGIFILEIIALWISITYIYKTIFLISKSKKWSFTLTLIYPFILLNQDFFISGGEAEEFILPCLFILIFNTIKIINKCYHATNFQYFIQGLLFSYVFWIKYTTTGAWIAFYICMFLILVINKNYLELRKMILFSILGFIIPTILVLIYFIINNALGDLFWGYFGWNYIYGGSTHEGFFKQIFFVFFHSFTLFLRRNPIVWILVIIGPYLIILFSNIVKQKSAKILLISMTFSSIGLELIGGIMYQYYQLMAIPFIVITLSAIAKNLKNINFNNLIFIPLISILVLIGILVVNPSIKQSNLFRFKPYQRDIAKIIKKDESTVSILDFNELDQGWYNYLNTLPKVKYFYKMNTHYNTKYITLTKAQLNIIKQRKVKYVICPIYKNKKENRINKIVFKYYRIIAQQDVNSISTKKIYLLERK